MAKFEKALVTNDYIFYCDFTECDENANTKIYNKNMILLSDNYFAYNELMEQLYKIKDNEIEYLFIHNYIKNYLNEL